VVLGAALLLTQYQRVALLFQTLALVGLLVGWLGMTRYLYGGTPIAPWAAMAIHTAALFILLSVGALALRQDGGVTKLLASSRAGGASARLLMPAAIIMPLLLAWVPAYAQHAGWLGPEAGLALFALSSVVVFGALVWANSEALERTDERREYEREARERSERRTHLIVENALDAVVSIDAAGLITGWNRQAELIFGWPADDVLGQALAERIIPPRYRDAHIRGLRRFLETGSAHVLNRRIELTALHRNGGEFPIELSIIPIQEQQGPRFSAFVRDISGRKQAEIDLLANAQRMRTLAESLPNLVWSCTAEGQCDYLSRQWIEYTGRPEAEQLGSGWAEQIHSDDRERSSALWAAAVQRKTSYDAEFRIRRHDGEYRWFKTRAIPLCDSSGAVIQWFGSNTDIEDAKRAERRLRVQLERLSLLDRTTRAIGRRQDPERILTVVAHNLEQELGVDFVCACLHDAAHEVLTVRCIGSRSAMFAAQMGLSWGTSIGMDANGLGRCMSGQLVYESDLGVQDSAFPRLLAKAQLRSVVLAPFGIEATVFGVLVAARHGTEGFDSGECEFLRHLSEHLALALHQAELHASLQRAYDNLRQTQQQVMQEERLRALGQMASGVAHDINNALSPAALYIDSLRQRESSLSKQASEQLIIIQRAIEDVAATVGRMREFSRRGDDKAARIPINLNQLVEHVVALTKARWSNMPQQWGALISVRTELAADLPAILGFESELRDAITNLVLNAADAMSQGGTLTIRSGVVGPDAVRIEVVDTGVGMDELTRQQCLEPFFSTKGERGTGLGLAMVHGTVERHGGEIDIRSAPGAGTRFGLTFPAIERRSGAHAASETRAQPIPPLHVLVIDDDPLILAALKSILEEDGHTVVLAEGGMQGIASFLAAEADEDSFSVVITDLGMPHLDGRKVAAAIKAANPTVPVLLLTGWGRGMQDESEKPEHVDRILSKPPKMRELRAALAELAGGHRRGFPC
jgi:PAS domain S-box-containing protein